MAETKAASKDYDGGCHCGRLSFTATLSPPLEERPVTSCNCSICRRLGYLLVYPEYSAIKWHNNSLDRCAKYAFNTKTRDHIFCPQCGSSIGIDFRDSTPHYFGVSVRSLKDVDLDALQYRKIDGLNRIEPKGDLAGTEYEESSEDGEIVCTSIYD